MNVEEVKTKLEVLTKELNDAEDAEEQIQIQFNEAEAEYEEAQEKANNLEMDIILLQNYLNAVEAIENAKLL